MRSRNRFSRRLHVATGLLSVGAVVVGGRMYELGVVRGPDLAREVQRITCSETVPIAYRGAILDRNGTALAATTAASRVAARRKDYRYDPQDAVKLAPLLDTKVAELDRTLRDDPDRFIWLSKSAAVDDANAIRRLGVKGIDVYQDQRRTYPQGPLAAQLIGFTGADANGLEGLERALDDEIRGDPVSVRVCRDVRGRVFLNESDRAGIVRGATVHLTLDATLQAIAEAELAAQVAKYEAAGGTVVLMDPRTGEILAMAVAPSFDPNRYYEAPKSARRNRAATDVFEPGSTAKALVIAGALDAGVITTKDEFFCENGRMYIGRWPIRDHHPYATLTVPEILKVSSNICTAKIGALLGAERLGGYLSAFGFGRTTGAAGLVGEVRGLFSSPASWPDVRVANVSFGQGISITALQLASAFATLANDGVRMKPLLIRSVRNEEGTVVFNHPEPEGRVVSAEAARSVSQMLEAVTTEGGTAVSAAVGGIRVAGKTGTAQKAENGHYNPHKWVSSFVGYLPAEDPRLVIAVVVDEPQKNHFGGVVAGPVFKRIAEASLDYLHIHRAPAPEAVPLAIEAHLPPRALPRVETNEGVMPDLRGLSLRTAVRALDGSQCALEVHGRGYVVSQQPEPGAVLVPSAPVALELGDAPPTGPEAAATGAKHANAAGAAGAHEAPALAD